LYASFKIFAELLGFFASLIRAGFWMIEEIPSDPGLEKSPPETPSHGPADPGFRTGNMTHEPYWHALIEDSGGQITGTICAGLGPSMKPADFDDPWNP
jgi:hypothetical protein